MSAPAPINRLTIAASPAAAQIRRDNQGPFRSLRRGMSSGTISLKLTECADSTPVVDSVWELSDAEQTDH
jgi:hypothetical protein